MVRRVRPARVSARSRLGGGKGCRLDGNKRGRRVETTRLTTGLTVSYMDQGDPAGLAVVLLHPWAESSDCFSRLLPLLPAEYHVLAMDQRGHGDADKPLDGYDLVTLAADTVAFMDAVGLPEAVLLGSSSGGYVAQQVALDAPERVTGLVLVGSPRSLQGRPPFADEVDQLTDPIDPDWVRDSLTWFPLFHEVPQWYIEARVNDGVRIPAHVWRDSLAGLYTALAPTDTGSINAPAMILCGELDSLLPRREQLALAKAIPGSELLTYEQTGHCVLWEKPERVAADLTRFLRAQPHRPPKGD